jgi:serine protease Do
MRIFATVVASLFLYLVPGAAPSVAQDYSGLGQLREQVRQLREQAEQVRVQARQFAQLGAPGVFFAQQGGPGGAYLGVGLLEVDAKRAKELGMDAVSGVEISSVGEDSPAERAGLQRGDVVLQFRGESVVGVEHFARMVRETPIGREVAIVVWRNGARSELSGAVGERKKAEHKIFDLLRLKCKEGEDCGPRGFNFTMPRIDIDIPRPHLTLRSRAFGAELEGIDDQFAKYFGVDEGVLVRSVEPDSRAARAGLKAGDVLLKVAGETVRTPRQASSALRAASENETVIEVMRERSKKTLKMEAIQRERDTRPSRGRSVGARPGQRL